MDFALIRSGSRSHIAATDSEDVRPADAERSAATLRSDFERWSRWALGVLSFILASTGAFVTVGMLDTILMLGGVPAGLDLVIIIGAGLVALASLVVLVALWWTGRRLLAAIVWWMRYPYTRGGDSRRGVGGWILARTVNFEPRILARTTTGTLALLIGVGAIAVVIRDMVEGVTSLTTAAGVVGVIALLCGMGQTGGVLRIVSGVSEGDPQWARIRAGVRSR